MEGETDRQTERGYFASCPVKLIDWKTRDAWTFYILHLTFHGPVSFFISLHTSMISLVGAWRISRIFPLSSHIGACCVVVGFDHVPDTSKV